MHPVLAPVLLRALRLLLPLAACGWAPAVASPIWSNTNELVHLYTSGNRKSFHLQILPNGHVEKTPEETVYSAVVLKTIYQTFLNIIGAKSEFHLCMHSDGKLYGTHNFTSDCVFKYWRLENHYEVYESRKHKLLVSLGKVKAPYVPNRKLPPFSQFLPRENKIAVSEFEVSRRQ